jgi:hypothetical protein
MMAGCKVEPMRGRRKAAQIVTINDYFATDTDATQPSFGVKDAAM